MSGPFSSFTRTRDTTTVRALSTVRLENYLKSADGNDRKVAVEGVNALKEGKLDRASMIFNVVLNLNVKNSEIHLLSAPTYHLEALAGDTGQYEMAEEVYRVALRFDPAYWLAITSQASVTSTSANTYWRRHTSPARRRPSAMIPNCSIWRLPPITPVTLGSLKAL